MDPFMGHIHSHNIVMQNCDALVSSISLHFLTLYTNTLVW